MLKTFTLGCLKLRSKCPSFETFIEIFSWRDFSPSLLCGGSQCLCRWHSGIGIRRGSKSLQWEAKVLAYLSSQNLSFSAYSHTSPWDMSARFSQKQTLTTPWGRNNRKAMHVAWVAECLLACMKPWVWSRSAHSRYGGAYQQSQH